MSPTAKKIAEFLESRIRSLGADGVVYYSDLAHKFGLPELSSNWQAHPLSWILGELDDEDASLRRPFRSAFVIAKDSNRPGPGFFKALANSRGEGLLPRSKAEEDRIWVAEINSATSHFKL